MKIVILVTTTSTIFFAVVSALAGAPGPSIVGGVLLPITVVLGLVFMWIAPRVSTLFFSVGVIFSLLAAIEQPEMLTGALLMLVAAICSGLDAR